MMNRSWLISTSETENDLDSKDGDVEEPDYLIADGSTELTPNEFLTMRRSEARTRRTSGRGQGEHRICMPLRMASMSRLLRRTP